MDMSQGQWNGRFWIPNGWDNRMNVTNDPAANLQARNWAGYNGVNEWNQLNTNDERDAWMRNGQNAPKLSAMVQGGLLTNQDINGNAGGNAGRFNNYDFGNRTRLDGNAARNLDPQFYSRDESGQDMYKGQAFSNSAPNFNSNPYVGYSGNMSQELGGAMQSPAQGMGGGQQGIGLQNLYAAQGRMPRPMMRPMPMGGMMGQRMGLGNMYNMRQQQYMQRPMMRPRLMGLYGR